MKDHLDREPCPGCGGAKPAGDCPHSPQHARDGSGDCRDCSGALWRSVDGRWVRSPTRDVTGAD